MAHSGDPVVNQEGKEVGVVTSCAIDIEGFLTGQAYIDRSLAKEGTPVAIHQATVKKAGKGPTPAVVVSRFPKLS